MESQSSVAKYHYQFDYFYNQVLTRVCYEEFTDHYVFGAIQEDGVRSFCKVTRTESGYIVDFVEGIHGYEVGVEGIAKAVNISCNKPLHLYFLLVNYQERNINLLIESLKVPRMPNMEKIFTTHIGECLTTVTFAEEEDSYLLKVEQNDGVLAGYSVSRSIIDTKEVYVINHLEGVNYWENVIKVLAKDLNLVPDKELYVHLYLTSYDYNILESIQNGIIHYKV